MKLIVYFISIAFLVVVMAGTAVYFQDRFWVDQMQAKIVKTEKEFDRLGQLDTKTLSAALSVFVQDQKFKDLFLEKDRDKLYQASQKLFADLKLKYGITHFYYILPDGKIFLRVHSRNLYDDIADRVTFRNAKSSKTIASGIELGKTAYALRVVSPYYNGNELIGYIEFGEEIDHFLDLFKTDSDNRFVIFGEKPHLDHDSWKSVRKTAGLEDSWDDMVDHVLISKLAETGLPETDRCFSEKNAVKAKNWVGVLEKITAGSKNFIFGGFPIFDASGQHSGVILALLDATGDQAAARASQTAVAAIAGILVVLSLGLGWSITKNITTPLKNLSLTINQISQGRLEAGIDPEAVKRKDEIGDLARSCERILVSLKLAMTGPEKKI